MDFTLIFFVVVVTSTVAEFARRNVETFAICVATRFTRRRSQVGGAAYAAQRPLQESNPLHNGA
jgi:hypothetical protein